MANISGTKQDIKRQNGVAKCEHVRACVGLLNLMNFGLLTAKNRTGVSTHPTGGHHAGQNVYSSGATENAGVEISAQS